MTHWIFQIKDAATGFDKLLQAMGKSLSGLPWNNPIGWTDIDDMHLRRTSMTKRQKDLVMKTAKHMKSRLLGEGSGHDWWHVHRVWVNARKICATEKANSFVVELAALLHDIADWKMHDGDLSAGPREARAWLQGVGVEESTIQAVCKIIETTSFKGAGVSSKVRTVEAGIVQDADRLDAIGAVGIARVFAYGGAKGREVYNPDIYPRVHKTFRQYKNNQSPSINHFYEKLLLLKKLMNTRAGKELANTRHQHMVSFLRQFFAECGDKPFAWNCCDRGAAGFK